MLLQRANVLLVMFIVKKLKGFEAYLYLVMTEIQNNLQITAETAEYSYLFASFSAIRQSRISFLEVFALDVNDVLL